MKLKILIPFRVFAEVDGVKRLVAETQQGSFGILPHRLDCTAGLAPGILTYESEAEGEVYVAVDEGILVKAGGEVLVSVRRAIKGDGLGTLRQTVDREFLAIDEREKNSRFVLAKLETSLIRHLLEAQHE